MAPPQYPVGEPCDQCGNPLSRYNPSKTCAACQGKLWAAKAREIVESDDDDVELLMPWELGPQRKMVRRGPLMPDTIGTYEQPTSFTVAEP